MREFSGKDGEGWDTSPALKEVHDAWERQVKAVMGRPGSEQDALGGTSVCSIQGTDVGIAVQPRQSSPLDKL